MMVGDGLKLAVAGVVVGLVAAFASTPIDRDLTVRRNVNGSAN
jgi:hypothetical protein